jgi:hypothetical protein
MKIKDSHKLQNMKRRNLFIITILCTLLFAQCNVQTKSFNTWFWTRNKNEICHLFIDEKDMGPLPQLASAPECDDESLKKQALFVNLPSGNYDVEVKDSKGNLKYSEVLRLKRSSGHTSIGSTTEWKESGSRGTNLEDCLIREIWY